MLLSNDLALVSSRFEMVETGVVGEEQLVFYIAEPAVNCLYGVMRGVYSCSSGLKLKYQHTRSCWTESTEAEWDLHESRQPTNMYVFVRRRCSDIRQVTVSSDSVDQPSLPRYRDVFANTKREARICKL